MKVLFLILALWVLGTAEEMVFAMAVYESPDSGCVRVIFNCKVSGVFIQRSSNDKPKFAGNIDCGKDTLPIKGRIKKERECNGSNYRAMRGARCLDLVPPPGPEGNVVHLFPPKGEGPEPVGKNTSSGCIHVSKKNLNFLSGKCKGKPFEVINPYVTRRGGSYHRSEAAKASLQTRRQGRRGLDLDPFMGKKTRTT